MHAPSQQKCLHHDATLMFRSLVVSRDEDDEQKLEYNREQYGLLHLHKCWKYQTFKEFILRVY